MTSADRMPEAGAAEGHRAERGVAVLVVDDQRIIGEAVRRMLGSQTDVRYEYCDDPTRALDVARTFRPTVILSDLVMPQMDGLDLVRRFREDPATRQVPLIVLSSREEPATKAEAFGLGANDYLVKLPDPIELIARVRYHSQAYTRLLERDEAYAALEHSQAILKDDLEQAAAYVRSLLPDPVDDRLRVRWSFIPSASLGGDAFGYHWLDEDRFVVYLLDVSGHGVGAALLGVSVLNVLRAQSLRQTDFGDPGLVLTRLNDTFRTQDHDGRYFTIWYGVVDLRAGRVLWSAGGHPAALLFAPDTAAPRMLEAFAPMPGVVPGLAYETRATDLPPGGRLLVFSDGVYEIRRPDGTRAAWQDLLDDLAAPSPEAPLDRAIQRARRLGRSDAFDDDVSVLEVEVP